MRRLALLALMTAPLAASCRETIVDHVPLDVVLPRAPECRGTVGTITLTALGDFPTHDADVAQLDGSGAPIDPVTRLPEWSLAFSVAAHSASAGWDAFGWATRDSLAIEPTLPMRPLGLSCPLADPEARLPEGAALAVLDQARVMLVGGIDETGAATRRVAVLDVRSEDVALPLVARIIPIAYAAATLTPEGDAVLVSGGASMQGGEGRDTWERIPLDGGMATFGSLDGPRRDHAAMPIDAGPVHGVLLVGGSDGSSPLDSIEWVDPVTDTGRRLDARLATARRSPVLVPLDDAHVAIAGGLDDHGAPVTTIELLDVVDDAIRTLSLPLPLPDWIAALPSGRLAWASSGTLSIVSVREERVDAAGAAPSVLDPVAVGLASGRVLLEGHRADGSRLGYLLDPGTGTSAVVATSRVPRSLIALSDGTTLELAAIAGSARRDERLTPFDSPPPSYLFAIDQASLALDAASRWVVTGSALTPAAGVDGARLDVPAMRFAHFEALFDATGAYDVVLTGEHLETLVTIAVTDDAVTLGSCSFSRSASDGRLRVVRGIPDQTTVLTEHGTRGCDVTLGALRVGLGVVAHAGAALRSLALQRDLLLH